MTAKTVAARVVALRELISIGLAYGLISSNDWII